MQPTAVHKPVQFAIKIYCEYIEDYKYGFTTDEVCLLIYMEIY